MKQRQQTREEWEQEVRDVQKNITYEDGMRLQSILLRKMPRHGAALISKSEALIFLLLLFFCSLAVLAFVAWKSGPLF